MSTNTQTAGTARAITRLSTLARLPNAPRVRLFCFHHAGGGETSFNLWKRGLASSVEVVPIEVPRRQRFSTLGDLVDELIDRLGPALDEPHFLFGHSFGALVAYRLACRRAAAGRTLPRALILSSFAPPHLPSPIPFVDQLDDYQLGQVLTDIGGLPAELTRWPSLREQAVASARIDLRLCMTDDEAETVPLTCPIHVFGGTDDVLVTPADLDEWRARTVAGFSLSMLDGNHFYLSDRQRMFAALRPLLADFPVDHAEAA